MKFRKRAAVRLEGGRENPSLTCLEELGRMDNEILRVFREETVQTKATRWSEI